MKDPGGYEAIHFDTDTDLLIRIYNHIGLSESFLNAMARSFQSWSRLLGLVWFG